MKGNIVHNKYLGYDDSGLFITNSLVRKLKEANLDTYYNFRFVGSRNYGYHTENSDFDIAGIYIDFSQRSSVFTTQYQKHLIGKIEDVYIDKLITIEYTLYEFEYFCWSLAHQSLNAFELLFSSTLDYTKTYNFELLFNAYFSNVTAGLLLNLISFAYQSNKDVLKKTAYSGFKIKYTNTGEHKDVFYSRLRLFQAYKLYQLITENERKFINTLKIEDVKPYFSNEVLTIQEFKDFSYTDETVVYLKRKSNDLLQQQMVKYIDETRYEMFYRVYNMILNH